MDSLAKLYDLLLCRRLEKWYKPDREQAGAQSGRGCMEQILCLRLLMDYALSKNKKLYITFVDFSKAYDLVPRGALLRLLVSLGCGAVMVAAIAALYSDTKLILGTAVVTASIGVRQGSPTSCLLFTAYVNPLITSLKAACDDDGFLSWIHSLLLMDDTIILATTREKCEQKVSVLLRYCAESGMKINQSKTKFMVVNGDLEDRQPVTLGDFAIQNCESYVYLGAIFTQDGKLASTIEAHCKSKQPHVLKFAGFVAKNCDFPFWIKRKVMESALMSAILYSAESWLCKDYGPAQTMYNSVVKSLLGVRRTTPNDICLIEAGCTPLSQRIRIAQRNLIQKLISDRRFAYRDPFYTIWEMCSRENTRAARYINQLLAEPPCDALHVIKNRITASTGTKFVTYSTIINPTLTVHHAYSQSMSVPEVDRVIFTRLRTSSHNLAIERGRWSRIPNENRLCSCGQSVQTEAHILLECGQNQYVRDENSELDYSSVSNYFDNQNVKKMCRTTRKLYEDYNL